MAMVVFARFSSSTNPVLDPDPPFTFLLDLLDEAPPPEPPDPPDPSDSFLPLCRPFILETSASPRRSRSNFDCSVLVSSGVQLSTAFCSFQSCPILGDNAWLPFAGPFALCIKRSQGLGSSVYWSKSLILEPCLLLGFSYINRSLLLLWNENVVLSLKLFLPQFEDVAGSWWSPSQLSDFIKQGFVASELVVVRSPTVNVKFVPTDLENGGLGWYIYGKGEAHVSQGSSISLRCRLVPCQ
ncbi:hypothetical protein Bca101_056582 [Brassica carinata]